MRSLLAGLDASQQAAASYCHGPLLVLGEPGSGKTNTLSNRIAFLLDRGAEPHSVLCLCFSTSAAAKVAAHVEELSSQSLAEPWIDTFHGFCQQLLREEAVEAGLDPFFCTLTHADRLSLVLDRIGSLGLGAHEIRGNPAPVVAQIIARIDRIKEQMITADEYRAYAESLSDAATTDAELAHARTELRFAKIFCEHERLLASSGSLDRGDLITHCFSLLHQSAHVRDRVGRRFSHVLVDDFQDTSFAQGMLLRLLASGGADISAFADSRQAICRLPGTADKNVADFTREYPNAEVIHLERSYRLVGQIARAASVLEDAAAARESDESGSQADSQNATVRFLRCSSSWAQAHAISAEVERLLSQEGASPEAVCVLVGSLKRDGPMVCSALEEHSIAFHVTEADAYFARAEVRDVLAWLRLLANPDDSAAIVRALSRPPVELDSVDIARLTQLASRRKLDMIAALAAACEGPQLSPEGRERAHTFLRLHRAAAEVFDELQPDSFVHRLIEHIELRHQQLFAPEPQTVERLVNVGKLVNLATSYLQRRPGASARDFARHITAAAEAGLSDSPVEAAEPTAAVHVKSIEQAKGCEYDHVLFVGLTSDQLQPAQAGGEVPAALLKEDLPGESRSLRPDPDQVRRRLYVAMTRARRSLVMTWAEGGDAGANKLAPEAERVRQAVGVAEEIFDEDQFGAAEGLNSSFRLVRDEALDTVARVGGRLGEMRLDTYLDVSGAVARFLELIKVAALIERVKSGQTVDEALPELNQLLSQGASDDQREALFASGIDDYLREAAKRGQPPVATVRSDIEPSLQPFIPRRGEGLVLSASDIETYRRCPLKYKFSRVLRIPEEPTVYQRFGIVVHQVLERFHAQNGQRGSLGYLMQLFEAAWRRCGFSNTQADRELRSKARAALRQYWQLDRKRRAEPLWFERSFSFRLGPHVVRGRVDRVDRHPDGSFELIDYKTGTPKAKSELEDDVQLSLYQMGAQQCWDLNASSQSYYYVLDNEKVFVEHSEAELRRVRKVVEQISESILSEDFEPKPSREMCSVCDYRLICPAAER